MTENDRIEDLAADDASPSGERKVGRLVVYKHFRHHHSFTAWTVHDHLLSIVKFVA
jgi:hypothetical protein